jgi:enoyl-CoA hydratase/carnithine racemase
MAGPTLLRSLDDGVLRLGFNRPERRNAIDNATYDALAIALADADQDGAVRVVVLHGDDNAFCAGNDIADFAANREMQGERPSRKFMRAVIGLRKPLIAAVNGPAVGIGATMLLHCDLIVAGSNAALVFPFVKLGLCPEFASSALLAQRIGHVRAAELFLLGRPCPADQALAIGLVNQVVPANESVAQALAMARTIAAASPEAVVATKGLMREGAAPDLLDRIDRENAQFARLLATPQAQAAFAAFLDKKP